MPRTRWVQADIARDDLRPAFTGADVVAHLAWLIQPSHDRTETWLGAGPLRIREVLTGVGGRSRG